ncbi:MAG: DUF937 domain-containing protein [Acidobacteriota bacterium]
MSILEMLGQQLDAGALQQMSQKLGTDPSTTSNAVSAALPMLMGALAKNSAEPQGAAALAGALDRDHDGSVLDDLAGFLGGGNAESIGGGILRHMLGGRPTAAADAVGQASGLDAGKASQLLAMLAPLVMGALGKQKRGGSLDPGGLAGMLAQERGRVESQPGGSILTQILDRDGDGQVGDDIASLGAGLLGGLLGGKRR